MYAPKLKPSKTDVVKDSIAALGTGALTEASIIRHIHPLFSKVLKRSANGIYLANHSLGRPLDQTAQDIQQALQLWYENMGGAWNDWLAERDGFRDRIARLINAPSYDSIVPKTSASQGLRTVLNCYDHKIKVITTKDEFSSIDLILKVYAKRGRIELTRVGPDRSGEYHTDRILAAIDKTTTLVVVSMVLFTSGQLLDELAQLATTAHARGAVVLLDLYHAAGVVPVNIQQLDTDFAIGGCYKYLRGGPGACWLYIHPRHLDGSLRTLDTGWFAQAAPFEFARPESPQFAGGGDAFLESTPAILPFYQARAGLEFTLTMGVERLRQYSLQQQATLRALLAESDIKALGVSTKRGAFLAVPATKAVAVRERLLAHDVSVDAREGLLRLCPDILNTQQELTTAVERLTEILKKQ